MDVYNYLCSLSRVELDALYEHPRACHGIYRALSPTARLYATRMVFADAPMKAQFVPDWARDEESSAVTHGMAVKELKQLRVWEEVASDDGDGSCMVMHSKFQTHIQRLLMSGGWEGSEECDPVDATVDEDELPTVEYLSEFASQSWNGLLDLMVGTEKRISDNLVCVLVSTGLLDREGRMTNKGFQFLLRDTFSQLWTLLLSFASSCESRGLPISDVLAFFFQLGYASIGKPYSTKFLSPGQQTLVRDLKEFGVVFYKQGQDCFYATPLGRDLTASISFVRAAPVSELRKQRLPTHPGYIIVETNFRVYAYTSSPLQIKLLSLFTALQYRLPNLVVGKITRARVRESLENGISANQILDYLTTNAHPEAQKRVPPVPEAVCDQILLWETERNRIKMQECIILTYSNEERFERDLKCAKEAEIVLWHSEENDEQKLLIIEEGTRDVLQGRDRKD